MLPIKGEFKDYNPVSHPEGFAFDVKNGVVYKGVYQNEEGTALLSSVFKNRNLKVIGILPIKNGRKVYFSIRPDGNSEVGIMGADGTYQTRVNYDLGFNENYPIDAEAQYTHKDELIVAFTDGLNTPKVINLDNVTLPLHPETIEMFPSFQEPIIQTELLDSGGSLRTGVYQIYIRYESSDGTLTSASHITNPIYVSVSNQNAAFETFEGSEPNLSTSKAIRTSVINLDTSYKYVVIGVISKIDGVIEARELPKSPILGTSGIFVFSGSETHEDVELSYVLTPSIHYKTIKHLAQVEGALYGAGVTEDEPLNLQRYVNQIRLKWVSTIKDVFNMNQSDKIHKNNSLERGYSHGEVYAFYIRFKLKDGGWTQAFHIPGRAPVDFQLGDFWYSENQDISTMIVGPINNFLNDDLTLNSEAKYFQTRDTSRGVSYNSAGLETKGTFGFWENQNEVYPNTNDFASVDGGEDLRGKKVRHHKFPSQLAMARRYKNSSNGFPSNVINNYNKQYRDKLSVDIDFIPSFPAEINEKITGWELMYAERSQDNSTVLSEGIATVLSQSEHEDTGYLTDEIFPQGGNFSLRDGSRVITNPALDKLKIHSFDLLKFKSALPSYIEKVGTSIVTFTQNRYMGATILPNPDDPDEVYNLHGYNFSSSSSSNTLRSSINYATSPDNGLIYKVEQARYFPQQVNESPIMNEVSEEFIYTDVHKNFQSASSTVTRQLSSNGPQAFPSAEISHVILKSYRQNVYLSYTSQNLVSTGKFNLKSSVSRYFGGDVFLGFSSMVQHFRYSVTSTDHVKIRARFLLGFISETRMNLGFRHEVSGNEGSNFYPVSPLSGVDSYFMKYRENVQYNFIGYNADYNSVNNISNASIFNASDDSFVSEDMHKIIRSLPANRERRNISWRQFLANDYYIIPRNRGAITNIESYGPHLFVNTEESLFITTGHEVLRTNELEVAVGTGDIFARPLEELMIDNKGYAGCRHKFSCLLTVHGYFFVDAEKRKVFMSDGKSVKDISVGRSLFFRDKMRGDVDNPFIGKGFTIGYDPKYYRIILSQVSVNPFTISFTPPMDSWTSSHDYYPNFLFNDRNELYALKDNEVFLHNRENYGQYYRDNVKPFHIVGIINEAATIEKMITNLNWRTNVTLPNREFLENITFHKVGIWNRKQATGEIVTNVYSSIRHIYENYEEANIRRKKGEWNFNKIRDLLKNNREPFTDGTGIFPEAIDMDKEFMYKRRLIDTYFFFKLSFNNQKIRNLSSVNMSPRIQVENIDYKLKPVRR